MRWSVSKRSKLGAFKSFLQQIRALDRRRSSSLYITKLGIHAAGSSKPACLGALPVCNFTRQHVTASAYAPDARTPCGRGRKKKSTQSHSLMRHGHAGSKSTLMCWSIYMSLLGNFCLVAQGRPQTGRDGTPHGNDYLHSHPGFCIAIDHDASDFSISVPCAFKWRILDLAALF